MEGNLATLVSFLIDLVYKIQREDIIDAYFYEFEAGVIKNIPLCHSIQNDVIIWPFTLDRKYTVKSGYKLLQNKQQASQPRPSKTSVL